MQPSNYAYGLDTKLSVLEKFICLMEAGYSSDSAYIRLKETVASFMESGYITENQKSGMLTEILGNLAANITNSSMQTALAWEQAEKTLEYERVKLGKGFEEADEQIKLLKKQQAQIDKQSLEIEIKTKLAQVQSAKVFGTGTFDNNNELTGLLSPDDSGYVDNKTAAEIDILNQQIAELKTKINLAEIESRRLHGEATRDASGKITKLSKDGKAYQDEQLVIKNVDLAKQKIKESQAATHKIVADTYNNFGNYTFEGLDVNGIKHVKKMHTNVTLADKQKEISEEQKKGFSYNAWSNSATASAAMLGTAMGADYAEFGSNQPGGRLLGNVLDITDKLKSVQYSKDKLPIAANSPYRLKLQNAINMNLNIPAEADKVKFSTVSMQISNKEMKTLEFNLVLQKSLSKEFKQALTGNYIEFNFKNPVEIKTAVVDNGSSPDFNNINPNGDITAMMYINGSILLQDTNQNPVLAAPQSGKDLVVQFVVEKGTEYSDQFDDNTMAQEETITLTISKP